MLVRCSHSADRIRTKGCEGLTKSGVVCKRSCRYGVGIIVDILLVKVAGANYMKCAKEIHCHNALDVYWGDIANPIAHSCPIYVCEQIGSGQLQACQR